MAEQSLENEKADLLRKIDKQEEEKRRKQEEVKVPLVKRQRFDDTTSTANVSIKSHI